MGKIGTKMIVKAVMGNVTAMRHYKLDRLIKIKLLKVKGTHFYSF
jgi:hypothetical protein